MCSTSDRPRNKDKANQQRSTGNSAQGRSGSSTGNGSSTSKKSTPASADHSVASGLTSESVEEYNPHGLLKRRSARRLPILPEYAGSKKR